MTSATTDFFEPVPRILGRVLAVALGLALPSFAFANEVEDVLALWGAQSGPWIGRIEIHGPDGGRPQTVDLRSKWEAVPGAGSEATTVIKVETFIRPSGQTSSVTLMFSADEPGLIATPYFVNGTQQTFCFSVVSVWVTDKTHWTTVIASPDDQEIYEGRPAVLRYVRTRSGHIVENTKEVNFLDDGGDETFELRSIIRQTLRSAD